MRSQIDTYVNTNVYGEMSDEEAGLKITGWSASIVEGAEEMDIKAHDNIELTLGERIRLIATNREKAAHGIDRQQYAFLQMNGLRKKRPVDRETWTVLDNDEALSASQVPYAGWDGARVGFVGGRPQYRGVFARFRSSVGGDVQIS